MVVLLLVLALPGVVFSYHLLLAIMTHSHHTRMEIEFYLLFWCTFEFNLLQSPITSTAYVQDFVLLTLALLIHMVERQQDNTQKEYVTLEGILCAIV